MAKNLKFKIKNEQLAQAVNLSGMKKSLEVTQKKVEPSSHPSEESPTAIQSASPDLEKNEPSSPKQRVRARTRSAFEPKTKDEEDEQQRLFAEIEKAPVLSSGELLRKKIFGDDVVPEEELPSPTRGAFLYEEATPPTPSVEADLLPVACSEPAVDAPVESSKPAEAPAPEKELPVETSSSGVAPSAPAEPTVSSRPPLGTPPPRKRLEIDRPVVRSPREEAAAAEARATRALEAASSRSRRYQRSAPSDVHHPAPPREKLGPTGRHIKDLLPPKPAPRAPARKPAVVAEGKERKRPVPPKAAAEDKGEGAAAGAKKGLGKASSSIANGKEFREHKPAVRRQERSFDARDKHGLRTADEGQTWRKKRAAKSHRKSQEELDAARPAAIKVRLPISVKDLASEMKLKASQLIAKLFMEGMAMTLNDLLDDDAIVQLLGQEFGCAIQVDTTEEERIRITDKTIKEEVALVLPDDLQFRAPVVTFMGHVDHGKTSLIDAIRKSNRTASEAGAITQHIGAFRCHTSVGEITILDTPGHAAFSAMRSRGADVTDIVVLVVAGDEGLRQQTDEAINHARQAAATIVVAINKCDKPQFNQETVYRQLADRDLLPEAWGGQTLTINCSAVTGEGIDRLLEMLALQAEVLELKASNKMRARGTVLESQLHKGLGCVATILVQNGTLRKGASLVFSQHWGRVKTMRDEHGKEVEEAKPSTPVSITGLSGLPEAGEEFIAVESEKEARDIAKMRAQEMRQTRMQQNRIVTMENLFQKNGRGDAKILNLILRADVQGSLEALKTALENIESDKVKIQVIMAGVGEISESDVQMADASKAVIIGFHTQIESKAEMLMKERGVRYYLHDVIYHAIDQVQELMSGMLDKIAEEAERGAAEVKAVFKSSQYGSIAGCLVTEGTIHRNHRMRLKREGKVVWQGELLSIKRHKDDVREVHKGYECGIVLNNCNDLQQGDRLESYEVVYRLQEL